MIYLITGQPGAGKSLYAIAVMVRQLMDTKLERDGQPLKRRLCVDGVKGLLLEHEFMAPGNPDAPDDRGEPPEGQGVWNWYEWCQPGDVLFIDEVQRWWRPRGMGVRPPRMVRELETHRHKGVDFVIVTQHPMLLDQNVRRLINRHIHVRRIFGMQRSMLYDWDGCQADTNRVSGATKSVWAYPKRAFELYKSAEVHTKQKQKVPIWLLFPVVVLAMAVAFGPTAWRAMYGAMTGKGVTSGVTTTKPDAGASTAPPPSDLPRYVPPPTAASAAAAAASVPEPEPVAMASAVQPLALASAPDDDAPAAVAGCAEMAGRQVCVDVKGRPVDDARVRSWHRVPQRAKPTPPPPAVQLAATVRSPAYVDLLDWQLSEPAPVPAAPAPAQPASAPALDAPPPRG